jgi:hypothetical protein
MDVRYEAKKARADADVLFAAVKWAKSDRP